MDQRNESNQLDEQRADQREALAAPVRVLLETVEFEGTSDNVSGAGVMLFTEDPIRVRIEIDGPDGPETRSGRLVRLQRMRGTSTGLAIEFDA